MQLCAYKIMHSLYQRLVDITMADIDISDPKYRQYRYQYPLLQHSLAYSLPDLH